MLEAAEHAASEENAAEVMRQIEDSQSKKRRGALTAVSIAQDLVTQV